MDMFVSDAQPWDEMEAAIPECESLAINILAVSDSLNFHNL